MTDQTKALLPVTPDDEKRADDWATMIGRMGGVYLDQSQRRGLASQFAAHRISHSLPGDVGNGEYVATDPRQVDDGDPYWMVEVQASGGYHSVAEIYSGTADNARAKAQLAMAAWSGSDNEAARELIAMLNAGGMQEGCRVFDHTPEEIGLHVMENHADILAALTPSPCPGDGMREALEAIFARKPYPERGDGEDCHRCAHCQYRWPDRVEERHGPGCAYVLARAALTPFALSGDAGEGE